MTMTTISVRTDKEIKEAADALFSELGMSTSTAVNIFLRKAVRTHKIPFEVDVASNENDKLVTASMEGRKLMHEPRRRRNANMEELFAGLDKMN